MKNLALAIFLLATPARAQWLTQNDCVVSGTVTKCLKPVGVPSGGTGLTALGTANQILGMNAGATALEYKTQSVGTAGTDFAITQGVGTVTFNLPDASGANRGVVTPNAQVIAGAKSFSSQVNVTTDNGYKITGSTITSQLSTDSTNSYLDSSGSLVMRTNGTTNAVTFNTSQVPTFTGANIRVGAAPAGNSSSPYLTPSNGLTTGLYFGATTSVGLTANANGGLVVNSAGSVTIAETTGGTGNVVHNCTRRVGTASGAGGTGATVTCSSGEQTFGGGCTVSTSAGAIGLIESYPSSTTVWTCTRLAAGAGTMTAVAMCCTY